MVFNRTSCAKRSRRAFTLAEYLVATSIGLIVLAAALVLWAFATKTCAALLGYVELSSTSKLALDRASMEIRNGKKIISCTPTSLVMRVNSGTNVTFAFNSGTKKLTMGKGFVTRTLLTECTNFQFTIYQRTPTNGSFVLTTNAWNTNTAKVVNMKWTCSRKVTGDKSSVETQVSANVVIRNP